MFYKGLKQPQIFLGVTKDDQAILQEDRKYKNDVDDTELDQIKSHMEQSKPFVDSELTLNQLAEQLNFPPRKLSQIINTGFGMNFMSFINNYRIEFAKSRLSNPKDSKETVMEVMYDCGFKSKSSFNTLFKEATGNTPSQFKKLHS